MSLMRSCLFYILDVFGEQSRKGSKVKDTKKNVHKIDNTALAIGMYCSGFPVLMIGLSQMIDDMLKSSSYESASFIYYFVGMMMVGYGMKAYYGRNKQMIITVSMTTTILLITTLLSILVFKPPV